MPAIVRAQAPLSRRIQARLFRLINVPMRVVLGLRVPTPLGRRLMLVFLTGRKTGRSYHQPVSYVRDGQTLLTPGGGRWKLNLVEARPVRIRLLGRDISARPEIVGDPDEVQRLYVLMAASNPMVTKFVGVPISSDGTLDRARLETAVRYGFRIIRWHLQGPAEAGAL